MTTPGGVVIHGIKACDTMRKARAWLEARGVAHAFHDYKVAGIAPAMLAAWVGEVGWEALLNRSGTTFRKLPEAERAELDEARAVALMLRQPSMIRRPVLTTGATVVVGFRPEEYARIFG